MEAKILAVDDEREIADLVELYLKNEGFTVYKCYDGDKALELIQSQPMDLALLDVMLPGIDGFELCRVIRESYTYPVIMLTARGEELDKINGLALGADDYITKPFHIKIVMEKIQAVLRRCSGKKENTMYSCGNLSVDFANQVVRKNGEVLSLTPTEFQLLCFLCKNRRQILTKEILLENIWDSKGNYVNEHTLSLNISRLRNKIADSEFGYIKTIYGMGYKWVGTEEE